MKKEYGEGGVSREGCNVKQAVVKPKVIRAKASAPDSDPHYCCRDLLLKRIVHLCSLLTRCNDNGTVR